jgi:hypothetical protein
MWVLVPTDEILFFACPKKSIQKKRPPDAAYLLRFSHFSRFARKDIPVLLAKCGLLAAPLRAILDKYSDARRGITGVRWKIFVAC